MEYTSEFEYVWQRRPKRDGGDPKRRAFKAWTARLKDGATPREMALGVARYGRWLESKGWIGTEFAMQLATFLGPDEHYANDWTPKEKVDSGKTKDRTVSQQLADRSWAMPEKPKAVDTSWLLESK